MKLIGITGTSGGGKSTVAAWLAAQGYPVLDGDAVSRQLAVPGSEYIRVLEQEFGPGLCDAGGNLLRRQLGQRVFAMEGGQKRLTRVTLPLIEREIRRQLDLLQKQGIPLAFLDGALIFDTPFEPLCDKIIAVLCDPQQQAQRIVQRDGISLQQAQQRLQRQPPPEMLRRRADLVLENNGTKRQLLQDAGQLLERLKEKTNGREIGQKKFMDPDGAVGGGGAGDAVGPRGDPGH